jgi:hypothetical protein
MEATDKKSSTDGGPSRGPHHLLPSPPNNGRESAAAQAAKIRAKLVNLKAKADKAYEAKLRAAAKKVCRFALALPISHRIDTDIPNSTSRRHRRS